MDGLEAINQVGTYAGTAVTFIVAGAGAYLGSYLKKKGDNKAIHEDIDKLVDQVKAVTLATKQVEATISKEMWQGKRNWEIKRDALFELVRGLGSIEYALGIMEVSLRLPHMTHNPDWMAQRDKALNGWQTVLENFKRDKMLALMVCGAPLRDSLERLQDKAALIANQSTVGKMSSPNWYEELKEHTRDVIKAVRVELELSSMPTSLSSESSAAPTPAAPIRE